MFFVLLCSLPYHVWHLNNVRAPLVAISLCWSQRPINSVVESVIDLSFFISPPSLSQFRNKNKFQVKEMTESMPMLEP